MHAPILAHRGFERRDANAGELGQLIVSSPLRERSTSGGETWVFEHPSGCEVNVNSPSIAAALRQLYPLWPHGLRLHEVLPDVGEAIDDLRLLHRHDMIDLRLQDPQRPEVDPGPLNRLEVTWGDHLTTARHTFEMVGKPPSSTVAEVGETTSGP
jgi:hypothetical protein